MAFHDGDTAFRGSCYGRVELGGSMSIVIRKGTQNTLKLDCSYLRGLRPQRDVSWQRGWPIWGKFQGEEWCAGRVTKRRSREGLQFILITRVLREFGMRMFMWHSDLFHHSRRRGKLRCDGMTNYLRSREYDTSAWTPRSREAQWGTARPLVTPWPETLKEVTQFAEQWICLMLSTLSRQESPRRARIAVEDRQCRVHGTEDLFSYCTIASPIQWPDSNLRSFILRFSCDEPLSWLHQSCCPIYQL
jgi:hypothetical protein